MLQLQHFQIDLEAVRAYFKRLRAAYSDDMKVFQGAVNDFVTVLMHEWSELYQQDNSIDNMDQDMPMIEFALEHKLMCARGLLMLMNVEELSQFDWF